jgi:hypothetical protein
MPGTGAALDHGGDAVELRRVIVAHESMAVAVHTAEVKRQSNILSLHMSWFARILFLGKFENLRADVGRWGWMRSVLIRIMSMLRRHVGLHIYRINLRPLVRQSPQPYLPGGITVRIVSPEELLKGVDDPELDLRLDFVRAALDRGDMAFGAFEGHRLVGYTWRTFAAAPDRDGLWARVSHPYQYSYKAFTRPSHRGKRIHVAITFVADTYLLGRGYAFEVGYMEITNFSSIGVANFLGRQRIGYAGYVKWFGRLLLFRTPAVKKIGFELFERGRKRSSLVGADVAIAGPEAGVF